MTKDALWHNPVIGYNAPRSVWPGAENPSLGIMAPRAHSPVPFAIDGEGATVACLSGRHRIEITAPLEANVVGVHTDERDAANAAFIVRACNSHEELLAALKCLRDLPVDCSQESDRAAWDFAHAAIAKAELYEHGR